MIRLHARLGTSVLLAFLAAAACDAEGSPLPEAGTLEAGADAGPDATDEVPSVAIGLPAGSDGLGFAGLDDGAELRLQTFGQGGTHLTLGVRTRGFGNRAYVAITLVNVATGAEALSPAPARPQLLYCQDDGNCDLVPILAMASGLVAVGAERDGVEVEVQVDVHDDDGRSAAASVRGVLSTKDL